MSFLSSLPIISAAFDKAISAIDSLIDNVHTSDEERLELKNRRQELLNDKARAELDFERAKLEHDVDMERLDVERMRVQASVVLAEAKGKSAAQRNWRPHLMYVIMAILVNNYLLLPYIPGVQPIEFPAMFWTLLTVSVGGYIGGRSYEKGGLMKTINEDGISAAGRHAREAIVARKLPSKIQPRPIDF